MRNNDDNGIKFEQTQVLKKCYFMNLIHLAQTITHRNTYCHSEEMTLCTIRAHQDGSFTATPALSSVEAEDYDKNSVHRSAQGWAEVANNGERLTTYTISSSSGGSLYEYSIECSIGEHGCIIDNDKLISERHNLNMDILEHRRKLIYKEFESSGRLYEECSINWSKYAHVEIVSARGFIHPNTLLSMPFGSKLMIKYRLLGGFYGDCSKRIILKGNTDSVECFSAASNSVEFFVHFILAFTTVVFVSFI